MNLGSFFCPHTEIEEKEERMSRRALMLFTTNYLLKIMLGVYFVLKIFAKIMIYPTNLFPSPG